jgi:hypothetical protein
MSNLNKPIKVRLLKVAEDYFLAQNEKNTEEIPCGF